MGKALESADIRGLFLAMSEGSVEAFQSLIILYKERIHQVAFQMTQSDKIAEDLCQTFFLKLWKNKEKLNVVRIPGAFMHAMISRLALDYLEKEKNHKRYVGIMMRRGQEIGVCSIEEEIDVLHLKQTLLKIIAELPETKIEVFRLRLFDDLSYEDISARLQITVNSAQIYFSNAIKHIRKHYEDSRQLQVESKRLQEG